MHIKNNAIKVFVQCLSYLGTLLWKIKVALNSFQHLYLMDRYDHSLSLDATIMVSKNFPTIGEDIVTIFVTE